jgi:hypothetical protein
MGRALFENPPFMRQVKRRTQSQWGISIMMVFSYKPAETVRNGFQAFRIIVWYSILIGCFLVGILSFSVSTLSGDDGTGNLRGKADRSHHEWKGEKTSGTGFGPLISEGGESKTRYDLPWVISFPDPTVKKLQVASTPFAGLIPNPGDTLLWDDETPSTMI